MRITGDEALAASLFPFVQALLTADATDGSGGTAGVAYSGELLGQGEVLQGELAVAAAEEWAESRQVAATRKCSDEGTGGVQASPKLVERTQWVQSPPGEGVAATPEPSLAG